MLYLCINKKAGDVANISTKAPEKKSLTFVGLFIYLEMQDFFARFSLTINKKLAISCTTNLTNLTNLKQTMNNQIETIVCNKRYASECLTSIPVNRWIDKSVGGCGLTYLALTDKTNCIILMPRTSLVDDKVSQYNNILSVKAGVSVEDVKQYADQCQNKELPIKIVTTYDSFALGKMDFIFDLIVDIIIYVDESQFLPELAKKDIKLSRALHSKLESRIDKVSFFSAHPPKREYMPEYIQKMQMIKYIWVHQVDVTPYIYDTKRPYSTVAKVLKSMVTDGSYTINNEVTFKKAIVFVNSVSAIVEIAEAINQPDDVGYIVGDTVKNASRLNELASKIKDKRNLPLITIGTSSMLAGIDLYDTETFNIIVSTTSKDWTLFDAELEIPQAITRQRLDANPNNDKFLLIYSKDDYESRIDNLETQYNEDVRKVNIAVSNVNILLDNKQEISDAFDKYYGHFEIKNNKAVIDLSLLNISKYRFQELFKQYKEGFSVMKNKKEVVKLKMVNLTMSKSYADYTDSIKECKSKKEMLLILDSIKNINWKEVLEYGIKTEKILTHYSDAVKHFNTRNDYDSIILHIRNTFKTGEFYPTSLIKLKLKEIYEKKSLNKTAKATDIYEFAEVKKQMLTINSVRTEGFTIIKYK